MGHYERHADYHGAYPKNLLKRYAALFFDRGTVIHVCSGMLKPDNKWLPGDTLDIKPARGPTYCVNAESCEGVPLHRYDTAFVDGPYGDADAKIYGYPMPVRQRVLGALIHGMRPGTSIVWLDEKNHVSELLADQMGGGLGCLYLQRPSHPHRVRLPEDSMTQLHD